MHFVTTADGTRVFDCEDLPETTLRDVVEWIQTDDTARLKGT